MHTMKFKNIADHTICIPELALTVPAGGICDVPRAYGSPTRASNGSRMESVIEMLSGNKLEPADAAEKAEWLKSPPHPQAVPKKRDPKAEYLAEGHPAGVAEILAAQAAVQAEDTAPKAKRK